MPADEGADRGGPGLRRRPNVGIIEVARVAGVSKSTASRALRHEARVSAETIEHVERVADSLGYVRDLRAAALSSTERATVGLLLRSAERSFYGELAAQVQSVMDERDVELLIVNGGDGGASQLRGLRNLLGHRVAGVLIASGRASIDVVEQAASFVPTVLLGTMSDHDAIDSVVIDARSEAAVAEAVVAAGHRRVGVTTPEPDESVVLHARTARFGDVLRSAGCEVRLIRVGPRSVPFAEDLRSALDEGVTCIMAGDDPTAVATIEQFAAWGVRVPEDISVTGFDGVGVYRSPLLGLTTMRQPVEELATAASELMARRLGDATGPGMHLTFEGELLAGRTLGPPPA